MDDDLEEQEPQKKWRLQDYIPIGFFIAGTALVLLSMIDISLGTVSTKVLDVKIVNSYVYVKTEQGIFSTSRDDCMFLKTGDAIQLSKTRHLLLSIEQYSIDRCDL